MKAILLVGLGGALGSVLRHALGGLALHHTANWRLPVGILSVNVVGCLAAGVLAALIVKHDLLAADVRLFLFAGVLGGFTTFSAFGVETLTLLRKGDLGIASAYVALSVGLSLAAIWVGFAAVHR